MESQKQQRKHQHRMQLRIPIEKRTKLNLPSTQTHIQCIENFTRTQNGMNRTIELSIKPIRYALVHCMLAICFKRISMKFWHICLHSIACIERIKWLH